MQVPATEAAAAACIKQLLQQLRVQVAMREAAQARVRTLEQQQRRQLAALQQLLLLPQYAGRNGQGVAEGTAAPEDTMDSGSKDSSLEG